MRFPQNGKGSNMLNVEPQTRGEIQARRIAMAAAASGYSARDLHRELENRMGAAAPHYESVRRWLAFEIKRELPKTTLEHVADVTGFSYEWVAGDPNVELPARLNRVNPRYLKTLVGRTTHPVPQLAA